jgi:formylmethanofuran:tetrahydromethanopterin formyltransferase
LVLIIMDKFLEKIQKDLDNKILNCVRGESIVKPFTQVYHEVRDKKTKKVKKSNFSDKESIYKKVIEEFLRQHPELINQD